VPEETRSEASDLLDYGDALISRADIASARLYYQRAADAGSAQGALRLGETYDPSFLAVIGANERMGDILLATKWYQRAVETRCTRSQKFYWRNFKPRYSFATALSLAQPVSPSPRARRRQTPQNSQVMFVGHRHNVFSLIIFIVIMSAEARFEPSHSSVINNFSTMLAADIHWPHAMQYDRQDGCRLRHAALRSERQSEGTAIAVRVCHMFSIAGARSFAVGADESLSVTIQRRRAGRVDA